MCPRLEKPRCVGVRGVLGGSGRVIRGIVGGVLGVAVDEVDGVVGDDGFGKGSGVRNVVGVRSGSR